LVDSPAPLHETLEDLALLADIRGDDGEAAMLRRGAALAQTQQIASDGDLGPLLDSPDSLHDDPVLRERLRHMYDAGGWVLLESSIADLPADLRWLFESGAVTIAQVAALHARAGALTAGDIARAIDDRTHEAVAGLDERALAAIADALPTLRRAIPRIPLGRASLLVDPLLTALRGSPAVAWASPAGSLRRGDDTVGDLEIIAAAANPGPAIDELIRLPDVARVLHRRERSLVLLLDRVQVVVRFPDPDVAGTLLFRATGAVAHVRRIAALAVERQIDPFAPAAREESIYERLGLPVVPPEIRDGGDEIAAALEGRLPALVSSADIRGDLHMHSTFSDGRDPVETMVAGCRALGYEYMAITDHSQRSAAARNLTLDTVKRQADEIAALREKYPGMAILHGCEVDIMPDGRLDFPDRVLAQFDIVLASLHDGAGQPADLLYGRYAEAMRHPLVSVITHPTNRMLPHRPGYPLDYDRLFELAVETGTMLEVDGAPAHLDLNGALARRAAAAGATLVIDSDCHRVEMLGRQMQFGLTTARRGWIEPRHVLNTRPLEEVRAAIARKRT